MNYKRFKKSNISLITKDSKLIIYHKNEKIQTKQYIIKPERFIIIKISWGKRFSEAKISKGIKDSYFLIYHMERKIQNMQNIIRMKRFNKSNISYGQRDSL